MNTLYLTHWQKFYFETAYLVTQLKCKWWLDVYNKPRKIQVNLFQKHGKFNLLFEEGKRFFILREGTVEIAQFDKIESVNKHFEFEIVMEWAVDNITPEDLDETEIKLFGTSIKMNRIEPRIIEGE